MYRIVRKSYIRHLSLQKQDPKIIVISVRVCHPSSRPAMPSLDRIPDSSKRKEFSSLIGQHTSTYRWLTSREDTYIQYVLCHCKRTNFLVRTCVHLDIELQDREICQRLLCLLGGKKSSWASSVDVRAYRFFFRAARHLIFSE